jgi:hypothetical protein
MLKSTPPIRRWILFLGMVLWLTGCTGRPYLIVDYRLPPAQLELNGHTVRLEVRDLRDDLYIFTPRARVEFRDFKERYSLAWITEGQDRVLAGEHDLKGLFTEAFKKRLEELGVQIVSQGRSDTPVFEVDLKELKIDLQNHKWMASVSYVATLNRDGQWIAREKIVGTAERVKIIGRKGADTVFSDIFTDILNRLDIIKLFEQAKLTVR